MSAGLAALDLIGGDECWEKLEQVASALEAEILSAAKHAGIPIQQTRVGTMFTTFFSETKPVDWNTVKVADTVRFGKFFRTMLENRVYLAPSQFEAGFVSIVHDTKVIDETAAAARIAFRAC